MYKNIYINWHEKSIKVCDSDFIEEINEIFHPINYDFNCVEAIIKIYSSKNLNVAYNLFLFLSETGIEFESLIDLKTRMNQLNIYLIDYQKYHSQIEKYLLLR